ncbi:MAG: long-chain fatty acid--CoA ligase [Actinobacteria bacterium]|nr:long-chain fatty acid--CoA ligase [Actinomycetota bacterium]
MPRLIAIDAAGAAFVDAMQRAWDAGDAVAPIDPRLPAPARKRLTDALLLDESVEPGDALVVATSGTSGEPKAVVLTHDAVVASALASSKALAVTADDKWWACLPLAHIGGLSVVLRSIVTDTPYTFEDEPDCSLVSLVPTMARRTDLARFRRVLLGGAAAPGEFPANVVRTYGMTETGSGVAYDGRPLEHVAFRIMQGEIQVRGPMLLRCYRDGTDPKTAGGWLPTGDGGSLVGGVVHVDGRVGDVINTGGEKVWPTAVERVLAHLEGVAEIAIARRADAEWGERVVAYVVPTDATRPPTLDALRDRVKEFLPVYAAPKQLVIVAQLPRTPSGKVRRNELG